jgi:hypothetical protein
MVKLMCIIVEKKKFTTSMDDCRLFAVGVRRKSESIEEILPGTLGNDPEFPSGVYC